MSNPLNIKAQTNGSGVYGTNSSDGRSRNNTSTRQRRNPADYGPFSGPHSSFDDPTSFPPYAELPFTSLKRRRQLQDNNSFVKWAMRAVLLSPVVVLVLWSVVAVMFANTHQVGQQQRNSNNSNNNNNNNVRKQSRRGIKRMLPPYLGSGSKNNYLQPNVVYMQSDVSQQQQQLQDQQGNLIYNVNGNAMMMAPQHQQLQGIPLTMVGHQQQQVAPMQSQGNLIPVLNPLGSVSNSIPTNGIQQEQQQQQQFLPQRQVPQQVAGGSYTAVQPQQAFIATNRGVVGATTNFDTQQQIPRTNLGNAVAAQSILQQPMTSTVFTGQQQQDNNNNNNSNLIQTAGVMQLQQQMLDSSLGTSARVDQMQDSLPKQAVYYYDPNDTTMSRTGDILKLPALVYSTDGKAIPLSELQHQAPIYVQPPILGSTAAGSSGAESDSTTSSNSGVGIEDGASNPELVSQSVLGASIGAESSSTTSELNSVIEVSNNPDLVSESAPLGASINMPKAWGASTSQDQTIIIATVAVMALLVGAVSARRLRSKSFLSSCIENETLENDVAYDTAYTTTAAASGAVGADSSYNTFGGWKGDLEKFDV